MPADVLAELDASGLDVARLPGSTAKIRLALDVAAELRRRDRVRVLDVGCAGPEPFNVWEPLLPFADRLELVGVDIAGLERAERRARELGLAVALRQASALELVPVFGADAFDAVVSTQVLEHIADWRGAVREMAAVLRPGALLFLTCDSGELRRTAGDRARLVAKRALSRLGPAVARAARVSGEWERGVTLADLRAAAQAAGLAVEWAARYCLHDAKAAQPGARGESRRLWLAFEETLAEEANGAVDPGLYGILYLRARRVL